MTDIYKVRNKQGQFWDGRTYNPMFGPKGKSYKSLSTLINDMRYSKETATKLQGCEIVTFELMENPAKNVSHEMLERFLSVNNYLRSKQQHHMAVVYEGLYFKPDGYPYVAFVAWEGFDAGSDTDIFGIARNQFKRSTYKKTSQWGFTTIRFQNPADLARFKLSCPYPIPLSGHIHEITVE